MEQLVLGADGRILNLGSLDYRSLHKDVPLQLNSISSRTPMALDRMARKGREKAEACRGGGDRCCHQSAAGVTIRGSAADAGENLEKRVTTEATFNTVSTDVAELNLHRLADLHLEADQPAERFDSSCHRQ